MIFSSAKRCHYLIFKSVIFNDSIEIDSVIISVSLNFSFFFLNQRERERMKGKEGEKESKREANDLGQLVP